MKKRTRAIALLLTFVCIFPLVALCGQLKADAAGSEQRFIFAELLSENETFYEASNDNCPVLSLENNQRIFRAEGFSTMGTNGNTNALYISFEASENANVTGVKIHYTYTQNNSAVKASAERTWTKTASKNAFVLNTPHVSQGLTALSIEFLCSDTPRGTVTLRSLFDVSVYTGDGDGDDDALATVKKCAYNKETHTVDITVQLSHEASVYYAGQTLELFALAPEEDPYLSNKTYVARAGVSLNDIHFSVPIDRISEIFSRYVIAAVNKEGMREPLCTPIYPDIVAESTQSANGFKGFHTDSLFTVIDSGSDVEIVDVYLDRLESEQGILYAGSHSYYHFDQSYVSELDRRVQNLTGVGCNVFLRFLISPDADEYSFVEGSAEHIVHKGLVINSEEALLDIHAYTDFLVSRYSERAKGKISGIIIGRKADQASTYGYVGSRDLSAYAELYATALNLIAGTARNRSSDLQIIVPVSDRMWTETVTPKNLTGDYFSELFLVSLLEALKAQTLTPPAFSVMLESSEIPASVANAEEDESDAYYGIDRLSLFLSMIREYGQYYSFLDTQILYSWLPEETLTDEELTLAYAVQHIALRAGGQVRSFFVDFSLMSPEEQASRAKVLLYLATYIDTDQCEVVIVPVLQLLGFDSVEQIAAGYQMDALKSARFLRLSLDKEGYSTTKPLTGSYELWNFSEATGLSDWYVGNSCTDLSVLSRALTAQLSATQNGEYADFAYHFPTVKDLSSAPLLRFSLGLEGTEGMPYEVQIRLLGKTLTVISSVVMSDGEESELYLDLSAHATKLTDVSGIRIMARPLHGDDAPFALRLNNASLESTSLSDEQLADLIASNKSDSEDQTDGKNSEDFTKPILVTVLVIVASVALAAIVIIRHRRGRSSEEKVVRAEAPAEKKEQTAEKATKAEDKTEKTEKTTSERKQS